MPLLRREPESFPAERGIAVELNRGRGVSVEDDGTGTCAYQGVKVPGYVYIQHTAALDPATATCAAIDEREFYDLTADPYQLASQATQASSLLPPTELEEQLLARVNRLHNCAGIRGRDKNISDHPYCE